MADMVASISASADISVVRLAYVGDISTLSVAGIVASISVSAETSAVRLTYIGSVAALSVAVLVAFKFVPGEISLVTSDRLRKFCRSLSGLRVRGDSSWDLFLPPTAGIVDS